MQAKQKKELDALLSLLDDTDPKVYEDVADGIIALGYKTYPSLIACEKETQNPLLKTRCTTLAHKIRYDFYLLEIKEWAYHKSGSNWDFVFLINEFCNREFNSSDAKSVIANYQEKFLLQLNETNTPEQNTEQLQKFIFKELAFKYGGQTKDLSNLLLDSFLTDKRGSTLLLCMLYVMLTKEANLPVSAVAFPGNIVLAYTLKERIETLDEILFYINPANGEIFSQNGIELFLKTHQQENKLRYYLPCHTAEIAALYVFTLREAYFSIGNTQKGEGLSDILDMLIQFIERDLPKMKTGRKD